MFKCELCQAEFLFEHELKEHTAKAIERAKQSGGKFALLARILEGDETAVEELQALINAGLVGRGLIERLIKIRANPATRLALCERG